MARRESEISGEERSVSDDMLKWQRVTFEERSVSDDGMQLSAVAGKITGILSCRHGVKKHRFFH